MARTEHNKLVRDLIPEIIRREGRQCGTMIFGEREYISALHAKLAEEARELALATEGEIVEELADIYEVVSALRQVYGIDRAELRRVQDSRRTERGAFSRRIKLIWTESGCSKGASTDV